MLNIVPRSIRERQFYKSLARPLRKFIARHWLNSTRYLPGGFDRIYHIHIRKSAGTSSNSMFWGEADLSMEDIWREPIFIKKGRVFVQHNKPLIEEGNYFFASSHFPLWDLQLPANTFTFTILRDPFQRLVSLYKYYSWVTQVDPKEGYREDPSYFVLLKQTNLLNRSFRDFVDALSPKYLHNQIFTFDSDLNVDRALERLKGVNRVYFFDHLDQAVMDLTETLNLRNKELENNRVFKDVQFTIQPEEEAYARSILRPEYEFYQKARDLFIHTPH